MLIVVIFLPIDDNNLIVPIFKTLFSFFQLQFSESDRVFHDDHEYQGEKNCCKYALVNSGLPDGDLFTDDRGDCALYPIFLVEDGGAVNPRQDEEKQDNDNDVICVEEISHIRLYS